MNVTIEITKERTGVYEVSYCIHNSGVGLSSELSGVLQKQEYRQFTKASYALTEYISTVYEIPKDQIEVTESTLSQAMDSPN